MRILVLLSLGACASSEPVRDGSARITFDEADRGTAIYKVVGGSNETACAHGEHFEPLSNARVEFGPTGGSLVRLSETTMHGTYKATAPVAYAPSYEFSIDGEVYTLDAPANFAATVRPMSPTQAIVELTDASVSSDVVVRMPSGRSTAATLVGSPATIDADFSVAGTYEIELLRKVEGDFGLVEIQRITTLTVP